MVYYRIVKHSSVAMEAGILPEYCPSGFPKAG